MKSELFFAAATLMVSVSFAQAASLQNKDSQSYDIRVVGTSTMSTSISGGTIKNSICSSSCTIEVKGVGEIEASGSDKIVIKDGKLKKR